MKITEKLFLLLFSWVLFASFGLFLYALIYPEMTFKTWILPIIVGLVLAFVVTVSD